jgi:hypothetical protein
MSVSYSTSSKVPPEKSSAPTRIDDCMELDSPVASPGVIKERAGEVKEGDQFSVHENKSGQLSSTLDLLGSILDIVAHESKSSSEDTRIAAYRKLAHSLMRHCDILKMERDAVARAMHELRQVVVKQRVFGMQHEADLEDILSRLENCNPRLR